MSKYIDEFKEFISQGNVMDMAVGVIIGGAFTGIVTSLTDDIINPIISLVGGGNAEVKGMVIPGTSIDVGAFISAVINFMIISFVVFNMVKALNKLKNVAGLEKAAEEQAAPPKPVCPHCLEEVKEGATRCPHCAGEIPGGAKA